MLLFLAAINIYLKEYFIPVNLSACVKHQNWVVLSARGQQAVLIFEGPGCWQRSSSSGSCCILSHWRSCHCSPSTASVAGNTKAHLVWFLQELRSRKAPTQKRRAQIPSEYLDSEVFEWLIKTNCPCHSDISAPLETHRGKQFKSPQLFLVLPSG